MQQFLQEQRISPGALHILTHPRLGQLREMTDHRRRVMRPQRPKVDGDEGRSRRLNAQSLEQLFVLGPRGQGQRQRVIRGDVGQLEKRFH